MDDDKTARNSLLVLVDGESLNVKEARNIIVEKFLDKQLNKILDE